jgi:transcriptional regulator of arginine metabolism
MAAAVRRLTVPGKPARQRAILDLVRTTAVRTQDDIVDGLRRKRMDVTQATVSRDIRELGLLRVHDGSGARYRVPVAELDSGATLRRLRSAMREHVLTMEFIDLIGVMRTSPGSAQLVAAALDGARFEEIAGTVAGDDTVIVITRARPAAQRLLLQLRGIVDDEGRRR